MTPLSFVQFVVKARVAPPVGVDVKVEEKDKDVDAIKRTIKENEEKDMAFLTSRRDNEELPAGTNVARRAHTPFWPLVRLHEKCRLQ